MFILLAGFFLADIVDSNAFLKVEVSKFGSAAGVIRYPPPVLALYIGA
jgi:hypothetical protein